MNEIVNKFLLAGDQFMPEMHLRQPGYMYVQHLWNIYLKQQKKIKIQRNRRYKIYMYQNEVEKACFQHDIAYGGFKDLPR